MRSLCFCLLLAPLHLFAKSADSTQNAIGLVAETHTLFGNYNTPSANTVGISYKRTAGGGKTYTATLGYSSFYQGPLSGLTSIRQDTAFSRRPFTRADLAVVGAGVEWSAQLHRKLYLFGGLEARIAYGAGSRDTAVSKQYSTLQTSTVNGKTYEMVTESRTDVTGTPTTVFYAGFAPYAGIRYELGRFSLGTAFSNYQTFTSVHPQGHSSESMLDLNIGNVAQRFFILYRF